MTAIDPGVRPFRIDVPEATIERITARVRDAIFPDRLVGNDWRYGTDWNYMRALADYWANTYDWRAAEADLNRYPQFLARVDGYDIHFYHVRGRGPRPMPLVLTHGWPGSVIEFQKAIGPLTDPAAHGGSPEDAFDVVIPSLPGFGFSSKPPGKPIGPGTTAALWNKLMTGVLGYPRYGSQGGDLANGVQVQLGRMYPDSLIGLHFNGIAAVAAPLPADSQQTAEERAYVKDLADYRKREMDYNTEQRNKPQTVALALSDSPIGAASWIIEKLKGWSDSPVHEPIFTMDQVITNVMIYLVTNTIGTAAWFYRGLVDDAGIEDGRIEVPTGFVSSPREMTLLNPPKSAIERNFNLVRYTKFSRGGHFAFWEHPDDMIADVRQFFKELRAR